MLRHCIKLPLLVLCIGFLSSCESELPEVFSEESIPEKRDPGTNILSRVQAKIPVPAQETPAYHENLQDRILNAIDSSECGATEFSQVQWKHFSQLAGDSVAMANFERYLNFNRIAPFLPLGPQYFGKEGEYTKLVEKVVRNLEIFWDMRGQVSVYGQHQETLNDREKLVEILWYLIQDVEEKEQLYAEVDDMLYNNSISPVLPESPFIASDGYATYNGRIVIGDGLVQLFTETGLEDEIVWTGILSHEWAHQVQFDHLDTWYPEDETAVNVDTRTKELEADFFSGYYMTHKRGATHHWKNLEEFFELFYQAGDCSFEFEQHHGTPIQRKQATYEGYLLAESIKKKGHISTPEELHHYFQSTVLPQLVEPSQYL